MHQLKCMLAERTTLPLSLQQRLQPHKISMNENLVKMSEICYQIRLVHIYTTKLLDGALLVIISFLRRHWQLLCIIYILLTVSVIGITKPVA